MYCNSFESDLIKNLINSFNYIIFKNAKNNRCWLYPESLKICQFIGWVCGTFKIEK